MSKDQVRRAIHVKRFSSAHEPQVGLSSLSSKNHKSSSVNFVSNSQRFRQRVRASGCSGQHPFFLFFSFLLSVCRNQNYCLKPKKMPSRFIFPCGLLQHLLYWSTFLSYFIQPLFFYFFIQGRETGKRRRGWEES